MCQNLIPYHEVKKGISEGKLSKIILHTYLYNPQKEFRLIVTKKTKYLKHI